MANASGSISGLTYGTNAFSTIQNAVAAASTGDTVSVEAGTYVGQVDISMPLTLTGVGSATVIQSPATLATSFTTSDVNKPVVYVHGTTGVTIENLTVNGAGQGNANYRFDGIAYYEAGGTINSVQVENVEDTPFSGNQDGIGIYADADNGTSQSLEITNTNIHDFQKGGMVLVGHLTVNVEGNTVQGAGDTTVTAQNGIEVGYGANGVIDGNTVNGIAYTGSLNWAQPASWESAPSPSLTISNNTVTNSQMAIDVDTTATITGNTITGESGNDWGIVAYANETITNNTISDVGGAIFIMAGDSTTSTITGNTLSGYAGVSGNVGLWTYDIPSSATVTLGGNS